MVSGTYFSTIAQVLPTLVIALVIEVGLFTDLAMRQHTRPFARPFIVRRLLGQNAAAAAEASADAAKQLDRWQKRMMNYGSVFLVGEAVALVRLMFNTDIAWLSWVAAVITFVCASVLAHAVVLLPVLRFAMIRFDQVVSGRQTPGDGK